MEGLAERTSAAQTRKGAVIGVLFIVLGLLVAVLLSRGTQGMRSTFALVSQRGGVTIDAPDLVLPTAPSLYVLGGLAVAAGVWQLVVGFRRTNAMIVLIAVISIAAFLVWASRGQSINLTGMLVSSLVRATPIALAALSGIWCERAGVVNIGIEGMMLAGAFLAVVFASVSASPFVGVLGGMLCGIILGALHAVLAIRYRVNQVISGTGIIILALGLTSYLQRSVIKLHPELNEPGPVIAALSIPGLWRVPVLGPLLFNQSPFIYVLLVLMLLTHLIMYRTRWGLRIRSVGEHPRAADTLGINVYGIRYLSMVIGGAIAGFAGAYMSIGSAGRFSEGMTAGKGFLGLAAMIFGNWDSGGSLIGSLIFGFFDSWQEKLAILQVGVPPELLGMAPYVATMIVLAGFVGRVRAPAADGEPYEKQ
jgi:ABC-type uncharacterized transport system permease subunit